MNDIEKGWLAGILDGEGSIGIGRSKQGERYIYVAQVQMVSCGYPIIQKYQELVNSLGMTKTITTSRRERSGYIGEEYYIHIGRQQDVKTLLEFIKDSLVEKQEQAEIVLEFVNKRIAANHRGRGNPHNRTYDGTEEDYCQRLSKLNRKRVPDRFKNNPD